MKTFKMRYYYIAPLVVLAMVACAKRDNDFAKKAAAARQSAQQQPQQKPGADTSSNSNKATPSAGTSTAGPASTDKTATPDSKAASADKKPGTYDGELGGDIHKDSCDNTIALEADSEKGDEEITLKEMISKDNGSYVLQSTNMFIERIDKDSKVKNQVAFSGSSFDLPKDFKDQATGNKIVVSCHTIDLGDKSTQSLTADGILPYDISTQDGAIKVLRQDKMELSKSKQAATTTLYAKALKLESMLTGDAEDKKTLIVKHKDSTDITITFSTSSKDDNGSVTKKTISGTYSLKK